MKERHALLGMLLVSTAAVSGCSPAAEEESAAVDESSTQTEAADAATVPEDSGAVDAAQTEATDAASAPEDSAEEADAAAAVGSDASADW